MLGILQKALDAGDKELQKACSGALMNMSLHAEHRSQMVANGGIPLLLKVTDHEDAVNNADVQEPAAGCLALIALDHESQRQMVQLDGIPVLIKLANSPHIPVMLAAAEALDKFVANDEYRDLLQEAGGVDTLQIYARKMVKERNKRGKPKPRPPRPYEKQPRVSTGKGSTIQGPPPRYRPITPGPLYEAEALSWWPGTEDRPLSRGDSHHASGLTVLNPQGDHRAGRVCTPPTTAAPPVVATMAETVFFAGEKLATPIMPAKARPQSRGGASAAVMSMLQQFQGPQTVSAQQPQIPKSPPSRASSRGGVGYASGSESASFRMQGPPAVGSSEGPRFYF